MKQAIKIIIILLFVSAHVFSQKNLTKDEIITYWNKGSLKKQGDSMLIVDSDSAYNVRLTKIIDSLKQDGIDSIIVVSTDIPGQAVRIPLNCKDWFTDITFIIWNRNGATYSKKIDGSCSPEVVMKSTTLHLFDYYTSNREQLKNEIFMPVIFSAQWKDDNVITYSSQMISHEPNYSFYYKIRSDCRSFHFRESYITNKKSLFYKHNLALAAYAWWKMVKQYLEGKNTLL